MKFEHYHHTNRRPSVVVKKRKKYPIRLVIFAVLTITIGYFGYNYFKISASNGISDPSLAQTIFHQASDEFDKTRFSTTEPSSLWVVVNKKHPISSSYMPNDLISGRDGYMYSSRISSDLDAMFRAADNAGISLKINSSYRSYDEQVQLYANYVSQDGQAAADTYSARAGFSEHQTGLALDINDGNDSACQFADCSAGTPAGKWLAKNSYKYGFIVRYTNENSSVTGYKAEPWHVRYVGKELSTELKNERVTSLESFFAIKGGDYKQM